MSFNNKLTLWDKVGLIFLLIAELGLAGGLLSEISYLLGLKRISTIIQENPSARNNRYEYWGVFVFSVILLVLAVDYTFKILYKRNIL